MDKPASIIVKYLAENFRTNRTSEKDIKTRRQFLSNLYAVFLIGMFSAYSQIYAALLVLPLLSIKSVQFTLEDTRLQMSSLVLVSVFAHSSRGLFLLQTFTLLIRNDYIACLENKKFLCCCYMLSLLIFQLRRGFEYYEITYGIFHILWLSVASFYINKYSEIFHVYLRTYRSSIRQLRQIKNSLGVHLLLVDEDLVIRNSNTASFLGNTLLLNQVAEIFPPVFCCQVGHFLRRLKTRRLSEEFLLDLTQPEQYFHITGIRFDDSHFQICIHNLSSLVQEKRFKIRYQNKIVKKSEEISQSVRYVYNSNEQVCTQQSEMISNLCKELRSYLVLESITTGTIEFLVEKINTRKIFNNIIDDFWPKAKRKSLMITLTRGSNMDLIIRLDERFLSIIITSTIKFVVKVADHFSKVTINYKRMCDKSHGIQVKFKFTSSIINEKTLKDIFCTPDRNTIDRIDQVSSPLSLSIALFPCYLEILNGNMKKTTWIDGESTVVYEIPYLPISKYEIHDCLSYDFIPTHVEPKRSNLSQAMDSNSPIKNNEEVKRWYTHSNSAYQLRQLDETVPMASNSCSNLLGDISSIPSSAIGTDSHQIVFPFFAHQQNLSGLTQDKEKVVICIGNSKRFMNLICEVKKAISVSCYPDEVQFLSSLDNVFKEDLSVLLLVDNELSESFVNSLYFRFELIGFEYNFSIVGVYTDPSQSAHALVQHNCKFYLVLAEDCRGILAHLTGLLT